MPGKRYEISDAYVMGLAFILSFIVTKVLKDVVQKIIDRNGKKITMANPRGGALDIDVEIWDKTELANIILECINDNEDYLVINPQIKKLVFSLVKAKLKDQSLVVSPNMMRFLSLMVLRKNNASFIAKFGKYVISSENRARLLARFFGASVVGVVTGLISSITYAVPYAVFILTLLFDLTVNCNYNCNNYFEKLPQEQIVRVYAEKSNENLIITGNAEAQQIEIYIPSKAQPIITDSETGKKVVQKTYKLSRKKAKQVNFSEFKKTDPVLASFQNLEEPNVPQKTCPVKNIDDVSGIN